MATKIYKEYLKQQALYFVLTYFIIYDITLCITIYLFSKQKQNKISSPEDYIQRRIMLFNKVFTDTNVLKLCEVNFTL